MKSSNRSSAGATNDHGSSARGRKSATQRPRTGRPTTSADDTAQVTPLVRLTTQQARQGAWVEALQKGGLQVVAEAPGARPEPRENVRLELFDISSVLDPEAYAAALRQLGGPLVLLLPEGEPDWIAVAARVDADAVQVGQPDPAVLRRLALSPMPRAAHAEAAHLPPFMAGGSDKMQQVWRLVTRAAVSNASCVISGETGVGKEVVARALHRFSPRRHGPFIAVNCAALPENLLESELFGHERGAFTGAAGARKGRFELADGGTLFLDEIGDLPLALQVKLLRVLQEQTFERVGGTNSVRVDVRVVAATHLDLDRAVGEGTFRPDLYFRLNVISIAVPPLRQRRGDILPLWHHFLQHAAREEGRPVPQTPPSVERMLLRYGWPGNIRELRNVAQHALTVGGGDVLAPEELPERLGGGAPAEQELTSLVGIPMAQIERAAILQTYAAVRSARATAEALGISTRKVHYRLKQYRHEGWDAVNEEGDSAAAARHRAPARVLLAEDDDELRWALADYLRNEGYQVVAVPNGRAVLEHLGASPAVSAGNAPPDVVITDLRMPGLGGMQLLRRMRESGWATPVVIITAFGDEEALELAERWGVKAVLDKPIDPERLRTVLEDVQVH